MASFFSLNVILSALELGCIYGLVALALYMSYSILNIADLSTDGCFILGCAVGCQVTLAGHPFLALPAAMCAGVLSGWITAFLQTRLGISSIIAGIVVNTGLYSINLRVMGRSSSISLLRADTLFDLAKQTLQPVLGSWYKLAVILVFLVAACVLIVLFLNTRLGLSIRATGDNAEMVRASSINPAATTTVGLCVAGSLTGLAGCLLGQYQHSGDINTGTGVVTIALASLIIGETLLGRGGKANMKWRVAGAVVGSCLYRLIMAAVQNIGIDASDMKLFSAVVVAVAVAMPAIRAKMTFEQRHRASVQAAKRNAGKEAV